MIRAKFQVAEITQTAWGGSKRRVRLQVQYDPSIPEDQRFEKATPSGHIDLTVDNPDALAELQLGAFVYVYFTPVVNA